MYLLNAIYEKATNAAGFTSSTTFDESVTVGLTTGSVCYYNGTSFQSVDLGDEGDELNAVGTFFDAYYQPDNLHGIKLYNEPYARDVFDTSVRQGSDLLVLELMSYESNDDSIPS